MIESTTTLHPEQTLVNNKAKVNKKVKDLTDDDKKALINVGCTLFVITDQKPKDKKALIGEGPE